MLMWGGHVAGRCDVCIAAVHSIVIEDFVLFVFFFKQKTAYEI